MRSELIATYRRESTLWKNANAFYVAQDWVQMDCLRCDYSEERAEYERLGITVKDHTGKDITEQYLENTLFDRLRVVFTNRRGNNTKTYDFHTREEANAFVKKVLNDKILKNFRRVDGRRNG